MNKKYDSFEMYLEDNYYNEIFSKIKYFINSNNYKLQLSSNVVPKANYIELSNFHIKGVNFHATQQEKITFKIAVEADIIIKGKGRCDYEEDEIQHWFSISCEGTIDEGYGKFVIGNVEDYSKSRFDSQDELTKYLVPYIYSKDLDVHAERFLNKYCSQALLTPMPLPIEDIINNAGLKIYDAPMSNNIFGRTYFAEAEVDVFDKDNNIIEITVEPGSILINKNVFFMRNIGSVNNTIIHECVHWDKHRKFFKLQKLLNNNVDSISCEVVEKYIKRNDDIDSALSWMEWQANALAPRILMPAKTTKKKFEEILIKLHVEFFNEREGIIMEKAIEELAEFFKVSNLAAKLRVMDLGYDQAAGTFIYINGKYLPPFSFKKGSLRKNQTYIIDENNILYEMVMKEELYNLVDYQKVVYANSMLCINSPKYININDSGKPELTDYALENVNECCLVFERNTRVSNSYDDSFYRMCFLCRDIDSTNFIEAEYNPDYKDNQDVKKRIEESQKVREYTNELSRMLCELPGSFTGTLSYHMKRKKITNEELAERSGLSSKTISTYRNKEDANKELTTVLALCIGLNLQYILSEDLIEKAGHVLKKTPTHMVFKLLLMYHSDETLEQWNKRLKDFKIAQQLPGN